jgi:hypothetical protein
MKMSYRRRQAIGSTYTDLQNAKMSADVMVVYLAYPHDFLTEVPMRMDETFATLLARFRVLFEEGMQGPKPVLNRHPSYRIPISYLIAISLIVSPSPISSPSIILLPSLALSPSLIVTSSLI